MLFERSEHEPDEYDPEEDFRDSDSDSLTIPQVDPNEVTIPQVETRETDVPGEIQSAFWLTVLTLNVAILACSLGILLLVFNADVTRGGVLLAASIALFGLAWRRYRSVESVLDDHSSDADDAATDRDSDPSIAENADDADTGDTDGRHDESTAETDSILESESDSPDLESDLDPDPNQNQDRYRNRDRDRP